MPRREERPPAAHGPDVILDVIFEDGLLFLAVENIGNTPAVDVSVKFGKPLIGVEGTREISALPLFRRITFLAPHRQIRAYLDSSASYFARRGSKLIEVTILFRDRANERFTSVIRHDLGIYKDLGYTRR